jgi:DNA-directed RNA polymerase subunit M/transcription elongation factor TFIIS
MGCGGSKDEQTVQNKTDRKLEKKQIRAAVKAHGGPRDALCHICGRKYTIHSIDIHVPQCEKLWLQRQALLPKQDRKPVPALTGNLPTMTLEQRNQKALDLHTAQALETCPYCSRTFLPDRLKVHVTSCERNHKRAVSSNTTTTTTTTNSNSKVKSPKTGTKTTTTQQNSRQARDALIPCEHCGRKFFSDRLQVHLRSCAPKL